MTQYDSEADRAGAVREIELTLQAIWEDLLETEVGPDDDFFDLGGYSLLVVNVVGAARKAGLALRAEDIFEHRTVAALASALLSGAPAPEAGAGAPAGDGQGVLTTEEVWRTAASPWDGEASRCLVPLAPDGEGEPFFCVHVGTGNIRIVESVVDAWRAGRPFYGFEAPGYRDQVRPLTSISAMAERYLVELRALQPHGPYFLGGLCQGGLVAFEMARRLRAAGEEVRAVVLVNPPSQVSLVNPGWGLDELLRFRLASLKSEWGIDGPADVERGLRAIGPRLWYDDRVTPADFYRLQVLWAAGMFAQEQFEVLPYAGRVIAFARSAKKEEMGLHWTPAVPNLELSWYDSPGTVPIMLDPAVAEQVSTVLGR
ncbi:thioesterase domain-containing protein [Streptomyces sp. NPDC058401]|uniref:thioesterase domain-containing protein n=1 Tax=Streptomyces sp. NPDC058401 TaxID=3346480 RepID=UPI00366195FD